jgi:hypothetical protein
MLHGDELMAFMVECFFQTVVRRQHLSQFYIQFKKYYDVDFKMPPGRSKLGKYLSSIPGVETNNNWAQRCALPTNASRYNKYYEMLYNHDRNLTITHETLRKLRKYVKEQRERVVFQAFEQTETSSNRLEMFQEACVNLGTPEDDIPGSITKCKGLLRAKFINIFDYIVGDYHEQVDSLKALRKRCKKKGTYPLDKAKHSYLLKALLKTIHFY